MIVPLFIVAAKTLLFSCFKLVISFCAFYILTSKKAIIQPNWYAQMPLVGFLVVIFYSYGDV